MSGNLKHAGSKPFDAFREGQRVEVCLLGSLYGETGTVVRLRSDGGAWVRFDDRVTGLDWDFPANDERSNWRVLYRSQCLEVVS